MPVVRRQLELFDQGQQLQPRVPIDETFPEQEANELARLESYNKHLFRPNTYLHKWWARRSGTTFRFILKQLVSDPKLRDYYSPGGLEGTTILDPMMGGGTTLHEAIRLGANVIGYDIDPIPVLQARATLSRIPVEEKEKVFSRYLDELERLLHPYFQTRCPICGGKAELQFTLYGARKSCACGEALLVDSFLLREETDGNDKRIENLYPELTVQQGPQLWPLFEKTTNRCPICHQPFSNVDGPFPDRYIPLVTVGFCKSDGQFFKAVDQFDLAVIRKAKEDAATVELPPRERLQIVDGPKSRDLLSRKIDSYAELFTPRQLLYISHAKRLLDAVPFRHRLWLALLISTSLEFNSILCGYKGSDKRRPGAIRHVFSHHAYSFPYTALENNPVFSLKTSGTLRRLFDDRIKKAGEWAMRPTERKKTLKGWRKLHIAGEIDGGKECTSIDEFVGHTRCFLVEQRDSSHMPLPNGSVDFVVTDPPYFNNVQYTDLSNFFRVWLWWFLPGEADWAFSSTAAAVAETEAEADKYRAVLTAIFAESNRVLRRPHGRLIFTFHHWNIEAWIQLTLALKAAGFRLVNAYTVHSENPISVHIRQLKALKHDSILVLQPKELSPNKGGFPPVERIDTTDSFNFCRDCALLLGFCLENDLRDPEIIQVWRSAIRG